MRIALVTIIFISYITACGAPSDPFERVKKLRAIGVQSSPLVAPPSTDESTSIVTLMFHLMIPLGKDITAEAYLDDESTYSVPVKVELDPSSASYEDFSTLRHYTITATVQIPKAEALAFSDENKAARLRYAVLFKSGDEEEKVVGTVFVQEIETLKAFKPLAINIENPPADKVVGKDKKIDIEAVIENKNSEPVKIGWFVSSGRVENRRSKDTKWETGKEDVQLLIATVRGMRSNSFAVEFLELKAE